VLGSVPAAAAPESETKTANPGTFAEKDLPLQQGQQVQWRIVLSPGDAMAPYDIHSHPEGGQVETHQRGLINGTESGLFTANATRTYSWLVTNALLRGTLTITFETEVLGGGAAGSGNPLPGPEASLVALAGLGALLLVRPPRRARPTLAL
jgi:hypothetical protein